MQQTASLACAVVEHENILSSRVVPRHGYSAGDGGGLAQSELLPHKEGDDCILPRMAVVQL